MSRTNSFKEATDSFAGWFCECVGRGLNGYIKLMNRQVERWMNSWKIL
jgi:hypothetical protein